MSSVARTFQRGFPQGPYAEGADPPVQGLDERAQRWAGRLAHRVRSPAAHAKRVAKLAIGLEAELRDRSDADLYQASLEIRLALRREGLRDPVVARSFALVREASRRHLGQLHHDVQLQGGWVILSGAIAEMETGEGKTLTATLPACTAAFAGLPVHVITVNDYLVSRDAELMRPVYESLGLTVGCIRKDGMPDERRAEYAADVTYCTNNDVTFDYLRDRLALGTRRTRVRLQLDRLARGCVDEQPLLLQGLCFGIVDEADSVLVDEARTPLIISGGGGVNPLEEKVYETAVALARELEADEDFKIDARERRVFLTQAGKERLEALAEGLGGIWQGPHRRGELVGQAVAALHVFRRDLDYLLVDDTVQIVDEYTGRVMPDRSWQAGLHQMIEAKEGLPITVPTDPQAQISYQRFFRRYLYLGGMTGTAKEVRRELWNVYRMPVVRIPTHKPLRRKDLGETVLTREEDKWREIAQRVVAVRDRGRPVLVGTRSVAASETLGALLEERGIPHRVLNARQDAEEAAIVAAAGGVGCVTVATNMAGRGTDIKLTDAAREAGGLHVIASERHESQRIDRQLFGRSGRQGDPGSYELIVSLEDELMQSHGRGLGWIADLEASLGGWLGKWGRSGPLRRLTMRLAQRRAEQYYAAVRRMTLKTDAQVHSMLAFSGRGE